jgi:hypothetical protein
MLKRDSYRGLKDLTRMTSSQVFSMIIGRFTVLTKLPIFERVPLAVVKKIIEAQRDAQANAIQAESEKQAIVRQGTDIA